jgi:hypothetical protein
VPARADQALSAGCAGTESFQSVLLSLLDTVKSAERADLLGCLTFSELSRSTAVANWHESGSLDLLAADSTPRKSLEGAM